MSILKPIPCCFDYYNFMCNLEEPYYILKLPGDSNVPPNVPGFYEEDEGSWEASRMI